MAEAKYCDEVKVFESESVSVHQKHDFSWDVLNAFNGTRVNGNESPQQKTLI